jgi:hypothetical protein
MLEEARAWLQLFDWRSLLVSEEKIPLVGWQRLRAGPGMAESFELGDGASGGAAHGRLTLAFAGRSGRG